MTILNRKWCLFCFERKLHQGLVRSLTSPQSKYENVKDIENISSCWILIGIPRQSNTLALWNYLWQIHLLHLDLLIISCTWTKHDVQRLLIPYHSIDKWVVVSIPELCRNVFLSVHSLTCNIQEHLHKYQEHPHVLDLKDCNPKAIYASQS